MPSPRSITADRPRLLTRLGWGHHGFHVASHRRAFLGLCLVLALPFVADQMAFQTRMQRFNPDLRGWLTSAASVVQDPHQPLYAEYVGFYIYPPFFLTLIWPLTKVPVPVAAVVFETLKWVALVLSLRFAWRLCSPRGEDAPPVVALGSLLLTWRFIDNDLGYGNINVLLLCAVLGACQLAARGRQFSAGLVLAVVACIKVTPALLLVYFLHKGWWHTLLGAAAGALICLVIWPVAWFGWEANGQLLAGWYHAVVAGFLSHGAVRSEHTNQALVGILNRLFGTHTAIFPDTYLTIVDLPAWLRDLVRLALTGGVLAGLAWTCRGRVRPALQPQTFAAEVSLVLIAMLLLSGLSWKSHFVTMLLPYSLLLAYLADARHANRRRAIGTLLLASFALCTLTSDIITPTGANYAEALGLITLGALAAAAAVLIVRRQLNGHPPNHAPSVSQVVADASA